MQFSSEEQAVQRFYDRNSAQEWARLNRHPVEFALTQKFILAHAPAAPAAVLDLGGGPGRYALWLAALGYSVTLLDLSKSNLEVAAEQAAESGYHLDATIHGTATRLDKVVDEQFDVVLLLGPLYHLREREDRVRAIEEAKRVLKSGGILFAAFLNRYGLVRYLARYEPETILVNQDLIHSVLTCGDPRSDRYATSFSNFSYWSEPGEIEPLMSECGFDGVEMMSAEGALAFIEEKVQALDPQKRQAWIELNYKISTDPELRGSSIHLVYAGRPLRGKQHEER